MVVAKQIAVKITDNKDIQTAYKWIDENPCKIVIFYYILFKLWKIPKFDFDKFDKKVCLSLFINKIIKFAS